MKSGGERLLALLGAFEGKRVAVLADLVADEYLFCKTSRISREAPAALILRWEGREVRPGGGANAMANLRTLGAEVDAVGVVGDDDPGHELLAALQALKIEVSGVRVAPRFHTVVKTRVLTSYHHSTRQQVLRVDREDRLEGNAEALAWLRSAIRERIPGADALLISDYGYGVAAPQLGREAAADARRLGRPATLDSRYHLLEHGGVSAATPNQPEVEEALDRTMGDDLAALESAGREVLRRLAAEAVLITRGSHGMSLFERGAAAATHIPVFGSDEIADVTGAGDTVIAVFTLALAAGASYAEAARLANYAGGIVVMKMGTATVSRDELEAAVRSEAGMKVVPLAAAAEEARAARARGQRVVLANGCFDLLHAGHIRYLEGARSLGDWLVVGVNADVSVRRLKGPGRPILDEAARAQLISALAAVDCVVVFAEPDVRRLLREIRPHVHVKGTDYTVETVPERETAAEVGAEVAIAGDPKDHSTRALLDRIRGSLTREG